MKLRLTALVVIFLAAAAGGVGIGLAARRFSTQQQPGPDRIERANRVLKAWNDLTKSLDKETELLLELQENLKTNSPHLVYDVRRSELRKLARAENEQQNKLLDKMEENDR